MNLIPVPTIVVPMNRKPCRHDAARRLHRQSQASGAPLSLKTVEYVHVESRRGSLLMRLHARRRLAAECGPLMRRAWRQVWNRHRIADENTGFHLVAVYEKNP